MSEVYAGEWVTRYSEPGHIPYRIWRPMPARIQDEYLDCAIYLYPDAQSAKDGDRIGGSGFLVNVPLGEERLGKQLYAVTNRHVVLDEQGHPRTLVIRLNNQMNAFEIVEPPEGSWILHPNGDDLAVCPIDISITRFRFVSVSVSMFISREDVVRYNVGPGDEAFLVGRFVGHDGKQRNLPTARFGNISMLPHEPVEHPMGFSQESFLVEVRSIGGYSGSPVFVHGQAIERAGIRKESLPMRLLGVNWGHLPDWQYVRYEHSEKIVSERWMVREPTGMATVVPAWHLRDLLFVEELVKQREKEEERRRQFLKNAAVADVAERPFAKKDFEDALKKASRKIEPSASDKPKK